ncbi:hypothetical protein OG990_18215 [Micromonospora sp. NBC_00858]|nr:hypothetical protein OG990_18215 [Micromonospora sp. NBC_00858]
MSDDTVLSAEKSKRPIQRIGYGAEDDRADHHLDQVDEAGADRREFLALGFRNFTNYIARSLLETGGFRPRLHPALVKCRSSRGSAKDTTETGNQ